MKIEDLTGDRKTHGNTVIWRYLSLDKFLDLIITKELFFANAARMTDKYEGLIPKKNQAYLIEKLISNGLTSEEAEKESKNRFNKINSYRESTLLNCWTINTTESYALWKIYLGGAKAGVSIKTTIGKLKNAISSGRKNKDDEVLYVGKVNYTDYIEDEPENKIKIITTKNKFYEYEKELRLFIFHGRGQNISSIPSYDIAIGRRFEVDIQELISEIYLSPFTGKWFDITMVKLLQRINPDLRDKIKNSAIKDE